MAAVSAVVEFRDSKTLRTSSSGARSVRDAAIKHVAPAFCRSSERSIKTIGDCHMAVAGLPVVVPDHADRAANMSMDMLFAILDFNAINQHPLKIRIGISSGAAVAGIIGKSKFFIRSLGRRSKHRQPHGVTWHCWADPDE